MKILIHVFALYILFGCTSKKSTENEQIIDFGAFSLKTPNTWTQIKSRGIDSYVGKIAIDSKDTLHFNLGLYSNTLREYQLPVIDTSMHRYFKIKDTSEYILVNKDIDEDKYRKTNISWDTIDGRIAKIVYPIRSGLGTTGIYIDSLWENQTGADKFNLYGENLSPINEQLLLKALKTLKFHRNQ